MDTAMSPRASKVPTKSLLFLCWNRVVLMQANRQTIASEIFVYK
jgi:hypothetical protein